MVYVAGFVLSGAVVVLAGTFLARAADVVAERSGLGRLWIGMVLLAGATSLPELATDVAAVRMGAPDLALGDLFGSSLANMLILAVVDLSFRGRDVLRRATLDHALSACLAIVLTAAATALLLAPWPLVVAGASPGTLLVAMGWVLGARAVYRNTRRPAPDPDAEPPVEAAGERPSLRRSLVIFVVAALVTLAAAPFFAWSASGLAEVTGLGDTFVGVWLVGLATSLPELVASVAAVRIGAYDLAVGNLFGSNACNMALLAVLDLAHPGGALLGEVASAHALSGVLAIVLTALGLAAVLYRGERRFALVEFDSALVVLAYAASLWAVYRHGLG